MQMNQQTNNLDVTANVDHALWNQKTARLTMLYIGLQLLEKTRMQTPKRALLGTPSRSGLMDTHTLLTIETPQIQPHYHPMSGG